MKILRIPLVIVLIVVTGRTFNAGAQTVTNLYSFGSSPTDGANPYAGLIQGSDGNFYGTTGDGGTYGYGTVFRISQSGNYTNLYSFGSSPTDGVDPEAALVQGSNGNFYGTTESGGTHNNGTVFRISPSGGYTNLYSFGSHASDGSYLFAGLVQGSDGNFYGMTASGGSGPCSSARFGNGCGTVFRISPSGSYTNLYSFGGYPNDGYFPEAALAQGSDGSFYGTTAFGGTSTNYNSKCGCYGDGTVFRIGPGGSYTNLYSFGSHPGDGYYPSGLVQGSDGNFYGTTDFAGRNNDGTVFRISPSGVETTLYSFGSSPADGVDPEAALVQGSDGNFYGTTAFGGTNDIPDEGNGTIFRISPSGVETTLYSFGSSPTDGVNPSAGLVQGSDGDFYGTIWSGGTNDIPDGGDGTVFKLTVPLNPPANQISAIQFFSVFGSTYAATLIPSVAKETYQLQYIDSMNPTNWINSGEPVKSIGGPLTAFGLVEPTAPQRFYRFAITR